MRFKRLLSKKLRVFCEHCTLHGAYYLARGSGARVAWGAIMAAGIALWCSLSHMIWQKYNIDPTVTVVESTYYRSQHIPFPAVMICDPLPVYGPKAQNISHILRSRGYDSTEIDEFYDSFYNIQDTDYVPKPYVRKMHSLLHDIDLTLAVLLEMFKKPCNVTVVTCRWRSKEYNCSDMFREVVTVLGHCCQFDIAYFRMFAPSNTTFVSDPRASQALDVIVDGVKAYPNGTVRNGPVLLYIFDAANAVTMMDSSIALAALSYFKIELEVFAIDSSPEVKELSLKTRKCVLPTDRGLNGRFLQKCVATLMMRKVVHYCKCLPFMYTTDYLAVQEYPNCTWEKYSCIYSQLEKAMVYIVQASVTLNILNDSGQKKCKETIKDLFPMEINFADMHSLIRSNDCYQSCDYVEYDTRTEFMRNLNKLSSENESYTRFSVHYASTTCMKYRREVIYTWDQMLANLGGIFGLCLGGSVISIIEIVWFLMELFAACLHNFTRKPTVTGRKVAFVIEKDNIIQDKKKDKTYKFIN